MTTALVTVPAAQEMSWGTFTLHYKARHGSLREFVTSSDRITHDWEHSQGFVLDHIHMGLGPETGDLWPRV
jgi:hypothetical protein